MLDRLSIQKCVLCPWKWNYRAVVTPNWEKVLSPEEICPKTLSIVVWVEDTCPITENTIKELN